MVPKGIDGSLARIIYSGRGRDALLLPQAIPCILDFTLVKKLN